ncbi:BrnT family toxin [Oscillatoria salina]|uniref:BrnT family toxin n=1 Tax=Oscillatoria salina TaxID=331517 RepID=UPI001CC9E0BD|nr:BrnT family toxin [Oscillatoria salina]MBZ8181115.1 BrnT family toxin [Oscillatoria salina IIICB1]
MKFEWDNTKNNQNIRKHKIDFANIPQMFNAPMWITLDERKDYREARWLGIGILGNVIAVVVWTEPQVNTIRIISARKANKDERNKYQQYLEN